MMNRQRKTYLKLISTALLAVWILCSLSTQAYAQPACDPTLGIPCIVPATPNDPLDPADGPNAAGAPNAHKTYSDACDADFMNQIYARAFIEAEREIVQGQTVLRKPDSVLEYTCFDQFVSMTARIAAPIFSETTRWRATTIPIGGAINSVPIPSVPFNVYMGPDKLVNSLQLLVFDSLNNYIDLNFDHAFLGGAAAGINNSISATVGGAGYNCALMNDIYFIARCNHFGTDDQFLSFDTLTGLDPRILPATCTPTGTSITPDLIALSQNDNFTYVNFDQVSDSYLRFFVPSPCEPPIQTGVMVSTQTTNVDSFGNVTITSSGDHEDKVCPNPSCFYTPPAGGSGLGTCTN